MFRVRQVLTAPRLVPTQVCGPPLKQREPYIYAAVLGIGGFVATTADESVIQTSSAMTALVVGFTIVPAILMTIATLFQRKYTLGGLPTDEKVMANADPPVV